MTKQDYVRVDGIKWWITTNDKGIRYANPICPQHNLRLYPEQVYHRPPSTYTLGHYTTEDSHKLTCEEGPHVIEISREFVKERRYVIDKFDAKIFSTRQFVTIDDEVIPVAREKLKDSPYWVDAKVTKSKSGTRLIVWAGNRDKKDKTQLFIEPELKKLSFDQNDTHPNEVFTIVEAKFIDGSSGRIEA